MTGGDHGYTARTEGMRLATGTHLAFLDDDDIFVPGALGLMRAHACDRPVIFRMDHYTHGVLWREPVLEFGNVSTQMFVVPNDPARFGVWAPHKPGLPEPGGDYTFLAGCVERMGEPVWREEVVAKLRPDHLTVAVVTPWQDHPELAADYLAAVSVLGPRDELIVVDNGSQPPVEFATIRFEDNRGFSAASNAGLHTATTDAVLFLNNDIEPVSGDWLDRLRASVAPGVLVGAGLRYDRHGDVDGHPLPYLDGWCLAGMTDDLLDLDGFDEGYMEPSYYGDNDLCLRARAAGMTLREVKVGLRHKLGRTSRPDTNPAVKAATDVNRERFRARAREVLSMADRYAA